MQKLPIADFIQKYSFSNYYYSLPFDYALHQFKAETNANFFRCYIPPNLEVVFETGENSEGKKIIAILEIKKTTK